MATKYGMETPELIAQGAVAIDGAKAQIAAASKANEAVASATLPAGSDGASLVASTQQKDGLAVFTASLDAGLENLREAVGFIEQAVRETERDDAESAVNVASKAEV